MSDKKEFHAKMKALERIIRGIAKSISYIYKGYFHRGICFYKRCLYGAILENRFLGAENLKYDSNIYSVKLTGEQYIKVGKNFTCRSGLRLEAIDHYYDQCFTPEIIIHDNVDVGMDCHIGAISKVEIGQGVLIGSNVYISDHSHGSIVSEEKGIPPIEKALYSKGSVCIGDNTWIGDGVVIMPGVTVGKEAIIGANAVVTRDIPDFSVAVGVPAKVIKVL